MAGVPHGVVELATGLDAGLQRLESHLTTVLSAWSSEAMACLSPAERASVYMAVSRALNVVYCLFLRTQGESPEDHPVKSEVERMSVFMEKVQYACDRSKAPRPSMSLNLQAATRFIEHSTDLTEEQRELVREAGKAKRASAADPETSGSNKKQKSVESVQEEAEALLAETSKELTEAR